MEIEKFSVDILLKIEGDGAEISHAIVADIINPQIGVGYEITVMEDGNLRISEVMPA